MGEEGVVSHKLLPPPILLIWNNAEVRSLELPECKGIRSLVGLWGRVVHALEEDGGDSSRSRSHFDAPSGYPLGQGCSNALLQSLGFRGGRWGDKRKVERTGP